MWFTSSYLGLQKGPVDYLFFLLTEDYIEANRRIREALEPLLTKFGRDLGTSGAVVKPFAGDETTTFDQVLNRSWTDKDKVSLREQTPALLVIESSLDEFDPRRSRYVLISLRDTMDEFGNVRVFDLQELFDLLRKGAETGDLFHQVVQYGRRERLAEAGKRIRNAVRFDPSFAGIGLDVPEALGALRAWLKSR